MKTGDNAKAEQLLFTQGYRPTQNGGRLELSNIQDSEVAEMNRLLVEHQIAVTRIEEHKKSLEDIFLELTGKERSL